MSKSKDDAKSHTSTYFSCAGSFHNKDTKWCGHNSSFFQKFQRYEFIQLWLLNLVDKHPGIARLEIIGKSLQGRDICMIVLKGPADESKIAVMLEAGIHAREWISPSTVLYFVNYVIEHQEVLEHMDLYVIPCLNPDGYEYTHTCVRLWRKNMNDNGEELTRYWGVDINRNFPHAYGLPGSGAYPTSSKYRGRYCLSEPEAQCLSNVLKKYGQNIQLYISVHAYGNKIMYPWGFTSTPVPDASDLKKCAKLAADAIMTVFPNNAYQIGQLSNILYLSSGGSSDFARGVHKIKFTFTIELQPGGESGFEHSVSDIVPVGEQAVLAFKAMIQYVYNYYYNRKPKGIHERGLRDYG